MKKIAFLLLLFVIPIQTVFSQMEKVNSLLEAFKKDSTLLNASWSFALLDNQNGKLLAEKDRFRSLLPASSLKIITTATALALLGENYRYQTSLYYTGNLDQGILHGDLIIKGSGDPSLGSDRIAGVPNYSTLIQMMVDSVKKIGIRSIEGRLIADESCFTGSSIPTTWNWSDMGNYFGAGAGGINLNENRYDIFFKPCITNNSKPIISKVEPNIESLVFSNQLIANDTVDNMDDAYIYGAPYTSERILGGLVPTSAKEFSIGGSIPDPALFMAQLFDHALTEQAIPIKYLPTSSRILANDASTVVSNGVSIFNYLSPSLKDIISITNQKSINLYAEALLKTIAKEKGETANTENGISIIQKYWQSKGLDLTGFYMNDGSGLSRHNAVSPYHFTQILAQISKEKYFNTFKNSLAVAGKSGTLKGLGVGTLAEGNIFAKSGTVERGMSYTGYVNTTSGKSLSFSIIFNNYNSKNLLLRQKISKLMAAMAGI